MIFMVIGLGVAMVIGLWVLAAVVQISVAILDWDASLPFVWPLPAVGRFLKRFLKRII